MGGAFYKEKDFQSEKQGCTKHPRSRPIAFAFARREHVVHSRGHQRRKSSGISNYDDSTSAKGRVADVWQRCI